MIKQTPGPYAIERGAKGQVHIVGNDGYDRICEVDTSNLCADGNAALLAAAPALIEALEACLEHLEQGCDAYTKAKAAITAVRTK